MKTSRSRPFFVATGTLAGVVVLGIALSVPGDDLLATAGGFFIAIGVLGLLILFLPRLLPVPFRLGRRPPPVRFRRQVLRLLGAAARRGESLGGALASLAEEVTGGRRAAVLAVLGKLDSGVPLGESLSSKEAPFLSPEGAAAVRAVEGTGRVAEVLVAADGREMEWVAVRRRAGIGLLYAVPCLLVAWHMATYILPAFFDIASQLSVEEPDGSIVDWDWRLPRFRDLMLARGLHGLAVAGEVIPFAAGAVLLAALGAILLEAARRDRGSAPLLRGILLRIPGPGRVVRLDAGGRVLRVMGVLASAGVPLHEVMSRAAPTAGVPSIEHALEEAAVGVAHGEPLSRVAPECGLPGFAAARLVAASAGPPGSFGAALGALGRECEDRALAAMSAAASWTYPLALVLVGGLAFLLYRSIFLVVGGYQEVIRPW